MITKKLSGLTIVFMLFTTLFSCSGDDDRANNGGGGGSANKRKIKFEVTGNFSSPLSFVYTDENSGTDDEQITSLPYTKELTYHPNVGALACLIDGNGGQPGQTVTLKIFAGGQLVSSTTETADAAGIIDLNAPVYLFN